MDLVYIISSLDSGQSFERSTDDVGMLYVPGGTFRMGSDRHYPEEAPVHRVTVGEFWMDRTPVTNGQFRKFVNATGYVTFAEITPDAKDYPGALPHMLKAGSLEFTNRPPVMPSRSIRPPATSDSDASFEKGEGHESEEGSRGAEDKEWHAQSAQHSARRHDARRRVCARHRRVDAGRAGAASTDDTV